jgi:hypothetical protein
MLGCGKALDAVSASLKRNPAFDLAERGQILPPIIKLGRARIGMIRHILGGFQGATVLQEHGDPGAPEGVIAERLGQPRRPAALFHDAQDIAAGEGRTAHPVRFIQRREQSTGFLDLRRRQVFVEILFRFVMQPDEPFLTPFFLETQAGALAFEPVVAAPEPGHGADPRKRIGHDRDDRAVAQPLDVHHFPLPPAVFRRNLHQARGFDGVKQRPHLLGFENRRDADLPAEPRAFHEEGRVLGHDLFDYQPVEQAAQRREVLFHGGRALLQAFDIGGHMQRPDAREPQLTLFAPAAELPHRLHIGRTGVFVADRGGEEFQKMLAGLLAGVRDDCRHGEGTGRGGQERGGNQVSRHRSTSRGALGCLLSSSRYRRIVSTANAFRLFFPTRLSISSANARGTDTALGMRFRRLDFMTYRCYLGH